MNKLELEPSTKKIIDENFKEELKESKDRFDKKVDALFEVGALAARLGVRIEDMFINTPNARRTSERLPPGTKREIVNGQIIDIVQV